VRDVFFPPKTDTTISTVTGTDFYGGFVNKFHCIKTLKNPAHGGA